MCYACLLAGPEVEVVRVAEDDLRAGAADLVGMEPADGGVGADRHERRRLHRSVREGERAGAGAAVGGIESEVEQVGGCGLLAVGYWLLARRLWAIG